LYLVTWEGVLPSEDRGPWRSLVSWDEVLAMMKDVPAVPNYMGRSASVDERGPCESLVRREGVSLVMSEESTAVSGPGNNDRELWQPLLHEECCQS
jgi:hypothetical protein